MEKDMQKKVETEKNELWRQIVAQSYLSLSSVMEWVHVGGDKNCNA